MERIKLYAVDYFLVGNDDVNFAQNDTGTMEIFYSLEKAEDFADSLTGDYSYEIFSADFLADEVYIEDNELTYNDCSNLIDWDTKITIRGGSN